MAAAVDLLFATSPVLAYRPFVSTDAAVAEAGLAEIEFGYAGFRADRRHTALIAPTVIANLGLGHDLELVGEFKLVNDLSHPEEERTRFEDTAVSLKWIAHEGVFQEHGTTPSLGLELSLVVPTLHGQHRPGGELRGREEARQLGVRERHHRARLEARSADEQSFRREPRLLRRRRRS